MAHCETLEKRESPSLLAIYRRPESRFNFGKESVIKTSNSDPIRVDFVDQAALSDKGSLGLTFAPGKYVRQKWNRDLELDLNRLRREYAVDTLVTLLTGSEIGLLRLDGFFGRVNANGMDAIWIPLEQGKSPEDVESFAAGMSAIGERLKKGQRVVVHCAGGLGRSGMVAACSLIGLGTSSDDAVEAVRRARPGAVESGAQKAFVREFRQRTVQVYADHYLVEGPDIFPVVPDAAHVFRSLLDEHQELTRADKAASWRIFDRFMLNDELPQTPLEAVEVVTKLWMMRVGARSVLSWGDEPRLRRVISMCLDLWSSRPPQNTELADSWALVYASRAAELVEPLVGFLIDSRPSPLRLEECQILVYAALRFDGYAFAEATGFDWNEWGPQRYAAEGNQLAPLEVLALFFASQRFLSKWGGETLPDTHPYWWKYRELFLRAVDTQVPIEYRHGEWWLEWKLRYEPRCDECVEIVAATHRRTTYDE